MLYREGYKQYFTSLIWGGIVVRWEYLGVGMVDKIVSEGKKIGEIEPEREHPK